MEQNTFLKEFSLVKCSQFKDKRIAILLHTKDSTVYKENIEPGLYVCWCLRAGDDPLNIDSYKVMTRAEYLEDSLKVIGNVKDHAENTLRIILK